MLNTLGGPLSGGPPFSVRKGAYRFSRVLNIDNSLNALL